MLGHDGRRLFDGTPEGPEAGSQEPASSLLATCPDCGDVVVNVADTVVVRGPRRIKCWYSFACPSCQQRVDVAAPGHLVRVLLCLGATEQTSRAEGPSARPEHAPRPAAEVTPEREPDGPLTPDEVIDLALSLRAVTDVTAFLEAG